MLGALLAGLLLGTAVRAMTARSPEPSRRSYLAAVAVVSWLAVMVGALATSIELAISGTVPLPTVLPAMLGVHALIDIGEAVITVAAVSAVLAARPDLIAIGSFGRRADVAPRPTPAGEGA